MRIVALGADHQSAPVALRERLCYARSEIGGALGALAALGAAEAAIITTCNRTEVYALWPRDAGALASFLAESRCVRPEELNGRLYQVADRDAVAHLFRVACGIESMMVGEYQVLGQVREALEAAVEAGTAGTVLRRLFETAVRVGRRARSETAVGQGAFSVGGCAVQLARSVFGDLQGRHTLIVGAGKMSEVTARHLADQGADSVIVANRTYERACQLADCFGGRAVRYDELFECLGGVDIVIASTSAPHAVICRDDMARVMRSRRGRPLVLIDIAVPRDVEPSVGELEGVYLYNIDDLSSVVAQDAAARHKEVVKVERIVAEEAEAFAAWRASQAAAPLIASLRGRFEQVRREQLERAGPRLAQLPPEAREAVSELTAAIVNKLLHAPTVKLRGLLTDGNGDQRAEAIRELFDLSEDGAGDRQ